MSKKNEITEEKVYTLEDLDYFWLPNGSPCFLGNKENICDIIENLGINIYYLISDKSTFKEYTQTKPATWTNGTQVPATTTKYTEESREAVIFKVVKNMIGRTISVSKDSLDGTYVGLEPQAIYSLPPIPMSIVNKLDEFFRLVEAQLGTESIVLLTFDSANPDSSDSWGILVPEQENTSVHCKYDPDSIVAIKPYHLSIVGSVHSHPGMAAYASGTDHEDQADFDGIHITYGWQKNVNNGATQYYAEMQMAGTAFVLDIEDVFDLDRTVKDPDPEVIEWAQNVSKKALPPYSATGVTKGQQYQPLTQPTIASSPTMATTTAGGVTRKITDLDIPKDAVLVVEVDDKSIDPKCPLCDWEVSNVDLSNCVCGGCNNYIATPGDTVQEIIELVTYAYEINNETTYKTYGARPAFTDIYYMCKDVNMEFMFLHIYGEKVTEESIAKQITASALNDDYDNPWNAYAEYTLCCNTHIDSIAESCPCNPTVTVDDMYDFELKFPQLFVYDDSSNCSACQNYLQPTCTPYRNLIIDWAKTGEDPSSPFIETCKDFVAYDSLYAYDNDRYLD
jgi:hypothetical protein